MPKFIFVAFLSLSHFCSIAQINPLLMPINTDKASPIGIEHFQWACVANFELSDSKNHGRIKHLDTDKQGNVYVIDNNGYIYGLSGNDFSEIWKDYLGYEHVQQMKVSPDGKTIAICYDYIKAGTKKLEVRHATNGRILLKIKRVPQCYESSYLADVNENTTLYPFDVAYSPDGSKLAVWFKNHGFDEKQCIANLAEELVIMNPISGDVLATKRSLPNDFTWNKCDGEYPFIFSADGLSIYVGNCRSEIAQYDASTFKLIKVVDFSGDFNTLLEKLGEKGSKNAKFPLHELALQQDGNLLTSFGKQGHIFSIQKELSGVSYFTKNQGTEDGHFSFSNDWSMVMFNADHINLWDLEHKHPLLFTETPNAFDAQTVRFHPTKKAILVGTKRTIKLITLCPISEIFIGKDFTPTGHYLNPETSFSVRGKGRIYWSFDDNVIYHKYSKEDILETEALGFSGLFNNLQNIPKPSELRLKVDTPGIYKIFGGTTQRQNNVEILQSLPHWAF